AELQIAGNVDLGAEFLTLNGSGFLGLQTGSGQGTGALHVLSTFSASLGDGATGVTLGSNPTFIGVDSSAKLVLNGTLGGGGNGLTKVGTGILELQGSQPNTYTGQTTINDGTLRLNKRPGVGATTGAGVSNYVVGDNNPNAGIDVLEID